MRGLDPSATDEEIEAAARQYVRKVAGVTSISEKLRVPLESAIGEIAQITAQLLRDLPDRQVPPKTLPPLRRPRGQAPA